VVATASGDTDRNDSGDEQAEQLADGVWRVPLPLPMRDLTSVNSYALESAHGLVLIDPGWASPPSRAALVSALDGIGYRLEDVAAMVITHSHFDHYTQAVALRRELGRPVYLGREEVHSVEAFTAHQRFFPRQIELLRQAGADAVADRVQRMPMPNAQDLVAFGTPDGWRDDEHRLDFGDRTLSVYATPGHTRGHVVIADWDAGLMFTGDHILPKITPAIGFEREPEAMPLRSYLSSLRRMHALPDAALAPAHGPVAPSVHARATQLLTHHDERLAAIGEAAAEGASAYEIAREMPWTRRKSKLDDLELTHQMMAILEVLAHMELLGSGQTAA
jgi:glyoxylase-like metal-dependent hydrolase (beta-lactamase superfamily II)